MKVTPLPPTIFQSSYNHRRSNSSTSLHLQHFQLTLSTLNALGRNGINNAMNRTEGLKNNTAPKLSLTLGYGMPPPGVEGLWWMNQQSVLRGGSHNCGMGIISNEHTSLHHERNKNKSSMSNYSTNLQLNLEQELSTTQSCQSTIAYHHTDQSLSFGTMIMRTFRTSPFSRCGIGIKHTFGHIVSGKGWWKQGSTWWTLQLERGDVRFLVPVSISPRPICAWDSLLRIGYASLASVVADVIVSELLCGITSRLRLQFLTFLLGEERVGKFIPSGAHHNNNDEDEDVQIKEQEDEEHYMQNQLSKAREDAARHTKLMARQARVVAKKEEAQGGLVIVKAVYGVIENESQEWLSRRTDNVAGVTDNDTSDYVDANSWHAMDATTQLQFWVTDSSLRLSAISKKHLLGFYDPLAFVTKDEWTVCSVQSSMEKNQRVHRYNHNNFLPSFANWWKKMWRMSPEETKRDLAVVLSIQYKWNDKLYEVMFHDDEAVDLPSQFAREVSAG